MQLREITKRMLSPFGIIRFSCSLLMHCFVKKRRRRGGANRRLGPNEDAVPLPQSTVSAAKHAIANVAIHVKPLRPVGKPCFASWLTLLFTKKPLHPVIQPLSPPRTETDTEIQIDEVRRRRCGEFALERQSSGMLMDAVSLGSWSSDDASEASESDAESFQFGDLCPRTSSETSSTRKGFNPTFYGMEISDEEDVSDGFRRLNSVVEGDASLKKKAHAGTQQLLLNPAYGDIGREDSESEVQTETKLKTLKSVVRAGCLALPASTALVGKGYIGRTSFNPTYGDIISSTSEEESDLESNDSLSLPTGSPFKQQSFNAVERLHLSSRSLQMSSFREMAESGISENMGTLTWSNVIFSHSEESDEQTMKSPTDLQSRWREILCTDAPELKLRPSPFQDPSTQLQALHFKFRNEADCETPRAVVNRTLVTPIRPITHDGFEDINLKCPPIHTPTSRHLKQRMSVSSPKGCSNFLTSGMKHTRGLLRWFYLLLIRIDGFLTDKRQ